MDKFLPTTTNTEFKPSTFTRWLLLQNNRTLATMLKLISCECYARGMAVSIARQIDEAADQVSNHVRH